MGAFLSRVWGIFHPPLVAKKQDALRFGILGAAGIGPMALFTPALSHPEVVIQAVAARNRQRAEEYAKKHGIPRVLDSYQDVIDDPDIDCIFVPLPNSLHYEWAAKAIKAGKHVLLEKPSVANHEEAKKLFTLPELAKPDGPVLLEAFHNRFHPAYALFRSLITPADVTHVSAFCMVPWWFNSKEDIYFNYSCGGGTIMHLGTYVFGAIRDAFGGEPEECLECEVTTPAQAGWTHLDDDSRQKIDINVKAKFRFPNGGIAEAETTQRGSFIFKPGYVTATHKEEAIANTDLPKTQNMFRTRVVTFHEFMHSAIWHRLDIKEVFTIRDTASGKVVKTWEESSSRKAYTFRDVDATSTLPGEVSWPSFRHQMEQFVNRIRKRDTAAWVDADNSIQQMRMIDMAYAKSGLGPRPTSSFLSES